MRVKKILIVEDEKDLVQLLKYNLENDGYKTFLAHDGEEGLSLFKKENPDLILLDIMLPKLNGWDFLKAIRRTSSIPIMMLTARKDEVDRVLGLEMGADDYVTKPFSVREVLARIKIILRRGLPEKNEEAVFRAGDLKVDLDRYEVFVKNKVINLGAKEFSFLKCLIQARGKALSREQLLEQVWGYDQSIDLDTRTIDQHVARLRDKLKSEAKRILTVKNVGYRLKSD